MLMTQQQQLCELQKKAAIIKGKETPRSSQALEARIVALEVKTDNSSDESLFADEKSKSNNRNNPASDRNEAEPDRAAQILDDYNCQKGTVSLVC